MSNLCAHHSPICWEVAVLCAPDCLKKNIRKILEEISISYLYLWMSQKVLKQGKAFSEEKVIHHAFPPFPQQLLLFNISFSNNNKKLITNYPSYKIA